MPHDLTKVDPAPSDSAPSRSAVSGSGPSDPARSGSVPAGSGPAGSVPAEAGVPRPGGPARPAGAGPVDDSAAALAGLDALDTPTVQRAPRWRRAVAVGSPPLVALVLFLIVWQALWAAAFWPEFKLPAPLSVWHEFSVVVANGQVWSILWTSISRAPGQGSPTVPVVLRRLPPSPGPASPAV